MKSLIRLLITVGICLSQMFACTLSPEVKDTKTTPIPQIIKQQNGKFAFM